jgi:hypothetical protein
MIRRSPAEIYIKYRLLLDRDKPIADVTRDLADELVFVPNEKYAARLRERMSIPPDFDPGSLGHRPSQALLRREGVWALFYPSHPVRQAVTLFENLRARMDVQTLITGGVEPEVIVQIVAERHRVPLSVRGLAEFARCFWNTRLLTRQELDEYVAAFLHDHELSRIAAAPPDEVNAMRAMAAVGVMPPLVPRRQMLERIAADCWRVTAACARDLPPGPAQTAALRAGADALLMLTDAVAQEQKDEGVMEGARRFAAVTCDTEIIDLEALGKGKVPYPVALLRRPDDAGAEDGGEGGGDGESGPG